MRPVVIALLVALLVAVAALARTAAADAPRGLDYAGALAEGEALLSGVNQLHQRVRGPRFMRYRDGTGLGGQLLYLEQVVFFPDGGYPVLDRRFAWALGGVRWERNSVERGVFVQLDAIASAGDSLRFLTPTIGLRLGRIDRLSVVAEASLRDIRSDASLDFDVWMKASWSFKRWGLLQLRGRVRDHSFGDRRLVDGFAAIGLEWRAPAAGRAPTEFLGIGIHLPVHDSGDTAAVAVARALESTDDQPRGFSLLLWVEISLAGSTRRAVGW